ncbi:protein kinase [Anaeramoeba flamelloides]|uniref:Protein kinase n=1 Tax=Anaeramoeba flamelloides TaxID=1746091 RepID=A0ABQ8X6H4_9EUKA|nr:protein kinase [Anaeramoeba flamelloides]
MNKVRREIAVQRLIKHPSILRIYEVFETKAYLFLVLEYVSGGELFDYIVECGRVSSHESRIFFQQIIYGLEHIHSFSITHRDLKPENLLLDKNNNVKIADFGMARVMEVGGLLQTSCGSPHYVSPEVLKGKGYDGQKSDIWSCGVILYALRNGCLPFDEKTYPELINVVKSGKFTFAEQLEESEKDLIQRMLTVDPNLRITLKQIKRHPWFTYNFPHNYISPSPPYDYGKNLKAPFTEEQIDHEILEQLEVIEWVNSKKLIEALKSDQINSIKIFYELFRKRQQKEDKITNLKIKKKKTKKQKRRGSLPNGRTKKSPITMRRKSVSDSKNLDKIEIKNTNVDQSTVLELQQLVKLTEKENDIDYNDFSEIINKVTTLDLGINDNLRGNNKKSIISPPNGFKKKIRTRQIKKKINSKMKKKKKKKKINKKNNKENKKKNKKNSPRITPSILSSNIDFVDEFSDSKFSKETDENLSQELNSDEEEQYFTGQGIFMDDIRYSNSKNQQNFSLNNTSSSTTKSSNINIYNDMGKGKGKGNKSSKKTQSKSIQINNQNNNHQNKKQKTRSRTHSPPFLTNFMEKFNSSHDSNVNDNEEEMLAKNFKEQINNSKQQDQIFGSPLFHRKGKIYRQESFHNKDQQEIYGQIEENNGWFNQVLNKKEQKKLNKKLKQQLKIAKRGLWKRLEQNQNIPVYICQDTMIAVSSASLLDVIVQLQTALSICNFTWSYPSLNILEGKIRKIKIRIKIEECKFEKIIKILSRNLLIGTKNNNNNNNKNKISENESLEKLFKTEQQISQQLNQWDTKRVRKWGVLIHFIWKVGNSKKFIDEVKNLIRFITE